MEWAITKCHLMHNMAMRSATENSTARGKFYDEVACFDTTREGKDRRE